MATSLFLLNAATQPGTGTNNAKANGSTSGWLQRDLSATRGSLATTQALTTVAGPTSGQEIGQGGTPFEFISPPLAAAVTIAGTVTFNIWGSESANTENGGFQVIVERYDSTMTLQTTVVNSERGTELTTSNAVNNWTAVPTSTAFSKGDRIRVRVLANDAGGTLGTGSVTLSFSGATGGAAGDTFVQFTEAITFASAPASSVLFLGDVVSAASSGSSLNLEAWTSRGSAAASSVVTSTAGWRAPIQFASSTSTDWFSRPLQAFTLSGVCRFNVWIATSAYGFRCEVALCQNNGTLVSVWGAANLPSNGSGVSGAASTFDVAGADLSVSNGQRLRFRIYSDDRNDTVAGTAASQVDYAGTSGGADGDTFVTMAQSLVEYVPKAPPFQARTARNSLLRR